MPQERALHEIDLGEFISDGDTITWGQASAEPLCLTEKLIAQRERLGHIRAMVGLSLSNTLNRNKNDAISVISYGALGTNTPLASTEKMEILPCNYSALPNLIASKQLAIDVVLVQLSPRGPSGHYSLGLANDYLIPAMQAARVVIAEVNDKIPCSTLDQPFDEELLDIVVPCSRQPVYAAANTIGETEKRIAAQLVDVIADGSVIQYGIGSVPAAILASLCGHQRLGIHSGMVTDDVIPLITSGVITNETNRLRPGVSVAALAIGSAALSDHLHLNPRIELHPASTTHSLRSLAQQDRLVAINSALEVDIYGQVNAEMIAGHYVGAVGGQVDFMHAASTHANGLSIVAIPSVSRNGKHSRIVERLSDSMTTTGKSDVDIIATEHGIADLRGKTLKQRAQSIRAIAAPKFQEALAQAPRRVSKHV